jgi:hypothetical protein
MYSCDVPIGFVGVACNSCGIVMEVLRYLAGGEGDALHWTS